MEFKIVIDKGLVGVKNDAGILHYELGDEWDNEMFFCDRKTINEIMWMSRNLQSTKMERDSYYREKCQYGKELFDLQIEYRKFQESTIRYHIKKIIKKIKKSWQIKHKNGRHNATRKRKRRQSRG